MNSLAPATPSLLDPDTLDANAWMQLMLGFFWRGIVYTLGCIVAGALVGGIAGGIIGVVLGILGTGLDDITAITGTVGFVLGLAVSLVGLKYYIRWLLRARFGTLRLVVVRDEAA